MPKPAHGNCRNTGTAEIRLRPYESVHRRQEKWYGAGFGRFSQVPMSHAKAQEGEVSTPDLWDGLTGATSVVLPGIGTTLIGGPLVAGIVATLKGTIVVGGLSVLGVGLYMLGIPTSSIPRYESSLRDDLARR